MIVRWCDGTYLEDQDFFRYSGVGRDCYLYARDKKRIEDVRVTPDLDADYKNGSLRVEVSLSNVIPPLEAIGCRRQAGAQQQLYAVTGLL
ncbi:MAG: hypothetical protein ACLUHA_00385 [Bacteroides stercoris]